MTERAASPAGAWLGAAVGLYAAAIALTPGAGWKLALATPPLVVALCGWTLARPGRWRDALLLSVLLLPPLPIELGGTGPHPALLFAALGLVAGLVALRRWRIPRDAPGLGLVGLFSVLLASVGLAALYSGPAIALGSLARVILFGISVYVYGYTDFGPGRAEASDPLRVARLIWLAGVGSALFACLDFYFQFPAPAGFGPQFIWLPGGVFKRAQGVFYEASTLGNLCCFFLVMAAVAMFQRRGARPASRTALAAGGAVLFAALVLSYSRASSLSLAIALVALLWLERGGLRIGRILAALAAAAAAAAGVALYVTVPLFLQLYWQRLSGSAVYFFSTPGEILSGRLDSWRQLAGFLAEHPWHALLGVGYKTLPYSDFTGRAVVADNMYVSMLVETGVVGLAALLFVNGAILRAGWRAARQPDPRTSFFGKWVFCFWCGQVVQMLSGDLLTYWRVLPVYFWVVAATVRLCHDDRVS